MPWRCASTASGYVPTLFATSPLAAIRSAPTTIPETRPRAISDPALASGTTRYGMPARWCAHAGSRAPSTIRRGPPCRAEHRGGLLEPRAPGARLARRERDPVAGRHADRRRSAHREPPDRVGHVLRALAAQPDLLGGQPRLVEQQQRTIVPADR